MANVDDYNINVEKKNTAYCLRKKKLKLSQIKFTHE